MRKRLALPPWPVRLRSYAPRLRAVMERGIYAICFDLDGVIIHTMPYHAQAWLQTVNEDGLRLSREEVYSWEGEPGTTTARRLLKREGKRPTQAAIRNLLIRKETRLRCLARRVGVAPSWQALLKRLNSRKIPLGLVTGTSYAEVRGLLPGAILNRFKHKVTGDRVKHGKPHPEPFTRSFQGLGLAPQHCIVVENAPFGIQSAKAAGAGCVIAVASSLPSRYLRQADLVVTTIPRLQRLLDYLGCLYSYSREHR